MDTKNKKFDNIVDNSTKAGGSTPSLKENPTTNDYEKLLEEELNPKPKHQIYTKEEQKDVNNITVTIPDTQTPIVVLFGAPSSGKTMSLLRMIRYLEQNNYQVFPEELFRPHTDTVYSEVCSTLKDKVYSTYAPGGTDQIRFMLAKVLDSMGRPICQILEAPGEHYFNGSANLNFPTYINAIRTSPNKKVWVFFVEQDWGDNQTERNMYAQKICSMQGLISPRDRVVFLINKVDKHRHQFKRNGEPNKKIFLTNIQQQYPAIFTRYQNEGLGKLLFGAYNFKFVCFTSGVFNKTLDDPPKEVWTLENDWYCKEFWNAIR